MKHESLVHLINCGKEASYSKSVITGRKEDIISKLNTISLDKSLLMHSGVLSQIQPQFFIQRNMGYVNNLNKDMHGQRCKNPDKSQHFSIGYENNCCENFVNTKNKTVAIAPRQTSTVANRNNNGAFRQDFDIITRSQAQSGESCKTLTLFGSDVIHDVTDDESDHVVVSSIKRPSHEILSLEYPNLVVPSSHVCDYSRLARFSSDLDIKCLDVAYSYLKQCGWYYGPLTMAEAKQRLKEYPVGTFLLRDSSDPNYLFSLSVKTRRGTTSIRIVYEKGWFRMDADMADAEHVVSFDCVMKLIENYVTKTSQKEENDCILVESTGRMDTPLIVSQGCKNTPGRLKHLCRVALNKSMTEDQRRRLLIFMPPDIEHYMKGYPFGV